MNEYSEENARIILEKLQAKGWNLYQALKYQDTVDPTETIRRGPVSSLEQDALYILLPAVEEECNPASVQNALRELASRTGGQVFLPHGDEGISLQAIILREFDVGVPVQKSTIGITYNTFIDQLDRLYDTKLEKQINYAKIDAPIRVLVQKLNGIPFIQTKKSRSGRLLKDKWRDLTSEPFTETELKTTNRSVVARPDKNHLFITGGYVSFEIDQTQTVSESFIADIKKMSDKHSFVKLKQDNSHWTVSTEFKDITDAHKVNEKDDFETRVKKLHQANQRKAEKRMKQFLRVRDEMIAIAEKYL